MQNVCPVGLFIYLVFQMHKILHSLRYKNMSTKKTVPV